MQRKPLIITISIGLILILAALGWFLFSRTKKAPTLTPVNGGSPFGQGGADITRTSPEDKTSGTGIDSSGHPVAKLFRITDVPVSGFVSFIKNGYTNVRYTERATGHIYDSNPVTLEKKKVTNNTLPKIYEAYFKNDGSGVIYRTLKDGSDEIQNSSLTLIPPSASSTSELNTVLTTNLLGNISDITVLGDNTLLYVAKDTGAVIHSMFSGDKKTDLFSSIFTNWLVSPFGSNALLTSKASAYVSGYSYSLNTKVGGLTKILGPLDGLSVSPSKDGKFVAYSYNLNSGVLLRTINTSTKSVSEIEPSTLGEKCVWSVRSSATLYCGVPNGGLTTSEPDSWYQGLTHFSDRVWRFNTDTGFTDVLADPKNDFKINLDVMNPTLSTDEDYLFFINKTDLNLWALKLN